MYFLLFSFYLFIDRTELTPLVKGIIKFDMKHNAEIPGCDLCLEIDQLNFLNESLDITNFERVCRYLESCAAYRSIFSYNAIIKIYEILSHLFLYYLIISEDTERRQILQVVVDHYLRFKEYCKAMLVALQLGDSDLVHKCLVTCPDTLMRKQLAFILVRQRVICHISYELFQIQYFIRIIY